LPPAEAPVESRAAEWIGAGLFVVYAFALFTFHDAPSMTDYANWTYQGVLLARHLQGFADTAHVLKTYPVPNSACTLGIGLLTLVMPWMIAAKTWLCVQMAISLLALRHLARTVGACGAVWIIVPQAVFLGVNWWYGFVNFQLGVAWVLLMASLLLRRARGEAGKDWQIGLVLVVTFFTHMIPFAFCGLLALVYARQTRRWRVLAQLAPAAVLSAWYLGGRYLVAGDADGQAGMIAPVGNYTAAFWAYKANSYGKSFGWVNPGDLDGSTALVILGRTLFVGLFAANVVLSIALGWLMIRGLLKAYRKRSAERFLWTGILLMVPLYLLAPATALGVSDPGSRVLQTALALGLVLACREDGLPLKLAAVCSSGLAAGALVLYFATAFGPPRPLSEGIGLPHELVIFGHVPNHDQDRYYNALERGEYRLEVFPTGMFLNRQD
jgi:hypothetical protein